MPDIIPFLCYKTEAEEAAKFYVSIFKNSKIDEISRYREGGPFPEGLAMVVEFTLDGREMMAINMGPDGDVAGSGHIALFVSCETQADVDRLWEKLGEGGELIQCGWLRDKFGISWNIVPQGLVALLNGDDEEGSRRAMQTMMQQVKLDIDEIRRAYKGEQVGSGDRRG